MILGGNKKSDSCKKLTAEPFLNFLVQRLDLSWNPVSGQMVASLVVSLAQAGIKLTGLVLNNCHNLANKGKQKLEPNMGILWTVREPVLLVYL